MGRMHANVYGSLPNAQLVAIFDHRPEKAAKFAQGFGLPGCSEFDEMLGSHEIDAIDICLPTHLHRDFTIRAAQAGRHVLCEKPMALTVADAQEMASACQSAGVQLMIGHCIRFWPEYALLKQMIDDRRYGRLLSLNLTRYGEFPSWSSENWLADESKSGGGALDMHIHDTDFALYALGRPKTLSSWGTIDARGPSHIFTTMDYGDAVIHLEGGWNLPEKTPFKMAFRAIFEDGAALMDGGPMTIYRNGAEPFSPEFPKMEAQGGGNISDLGGYYVEIKYFVDRLKAGLPFEVVTPESSIASLETALEEIRQVRQKMDRS
jgi:predicted dehydrogenase